MDAGITTTGGAQPAPLPRPVRRPAGPQRQVLAPPPARVACSHPRPASTSRSPSAPPPAPSPQDMRESRPGGGAQVRRGRRRRKPGSGRAAEESQASIPWGYGPEQSPPCRSIPIACSSTGRSPRPPSRRRAASLGPAATEAWLSLRIYDVTGRLFDGTNAHGYFDQTWASIVRSAVVLPGRQAHLAGHRGDRSQVPRGLLRQDRSVRPGGPSRARSRSAWRRSRVDVRAGRAPVRCRAPAAGWRREVAAAGAGPGGAGRHRAGRARGRLGPRGWLGEAGGVEASLCPRASVPDVRRCSGLGAATKSCARPTNLRWERDRRDRASIAGGLPGFLELAGGDSAARLLVGGAFSYPVADPCAHARELRRPGAGLPLRQAHARGVGALAGHHQGHRRARRAREVLGLADGPRLDATRVWREVVTTGDTPVHWAVPAPAPPTLAPGGSELRLVGASERYRLGASELRLGGRQRTRLRRAASELRAPGGAVGAAVRRGQRAALWRGQRAAPVAGPASAGWAAPVNGAWGAAASASGRRQRRPPAGRRRHVEQTPADGRAAGPAAAAQGLPT